MVERMQSKARLSGKVFRSRIPTLLVSMFATFASIYVAGRLWQDSENRVYLIKELDRITGQGGSVISVDDTLKIIACREQHKKLSAVEMELAAARQEGFTLKRSTLKNGTRPLVVIGIFTKFGRKNNRDAIRKAWMGTGTALKNMENQKGIIARFVIGRSANHGDSLDRAIDNENRQTKDFLILDTHLEAPEEFSKKAKLFFAHVADKWDAEFYAKVNDDVYVNIDVLGATLATQLDKPRIYIGCMKSGEVFSEPNQNWYEPEWWKFGDKKSYFRHASEIFSVPTPMMMSVSDLGLLGLMLNILMTPSFAAPLGREEPFALVYDLICFEVMDKVKRDAGRWIERHWIHIH